MPFKTTALTTSVICFCLAGVWAFGSAILLNLWGVDYAASAELVGRRGAALFLGVGVMLLLARDAEPSQARTSLTVGLIVACTALALLGVLEFVLGNVGFGILSAVIVELMIALAFLRIELMTPYRTRVTNQIPVIGDEWMNFRTWPGAESHGGQVEETPMRAWAALAWRLRKPLLRHNLPCNRPRRA
jgi:hypothetical protein